MTRVLFLTRYPVEGASSRYRVLQYLPHLKAQGVQADVQSFMDTPMYRLSLAPGRTGNKIAATLKATVRRLWALRRWRDYDALYLQRELLPFGPPLIEAALKKRGAVLFFDYDDALFIKKASRYNRIATALRSADKTRDLFRLVHCVVAGNNWLRDAAREAGAARAVTLEVAEDTGRIPMHAPHDNDTPVTIGWLGSPSTVKYLRFIEPVLQRVAQRYPQVRWEIMGGNDFRMDGVDWQLSDWSLDGEVAALGRFDIGLMPLPAEDWAKGKSGGKARTYMAAGIVPVVSAIGYNTELIHHGETGFLCETPEDWETHLVRAIEDADLRQRVALAARAEVEDRFDPALIAANMAALLRDVVDDVEKR
ncbi:Glycosyltransferase involved in cell wall bisynthesis [Roseivivax halotolerans]|uniref:Glycosyltransferase involved in cell wall bisynthesis n=1 Tax=Roseivivax halotolerans TaxID=93684 RepID=A0A1I6A2C7_9RHOB|nr:glycosyltransferase [Roseivivax halotolerans]SFQ62881.1 Glycosyltransferase involved in cell wall bisynthesis [Roseivivax halotolerans]